jgi:hypothetical protein
MSEPMETTFETRVLVSLAEIQGSIAIVQVQSDSYSKRLDEHWEEIKLLKANQAKTIGGAVTLAVIIPIFISIAALFLGRLGG